MNISVNSLLELDSLSRRRFLKRTALGIVALGFSRYVLAGSVSPDFMASSRSSIHFLTPKQFQILESVCDRLIQKSEGMPGAQELKVAASIDAYLESIDRPVAEQIAQLIDLFEISPWLFDFKWARFTSLSPAEQDQVLISWSTSRFDFRRTGFHALKRLSMAAYYGQEATWKAIGYEGPLV